MVAKAMGFRFGVDFGADLRLYSGLSNLVYPVVMFLNGESGGQQVLKGLLVQYQFGPVRGHGSGGRKSYSYCNANRGIMKRKITEAFWDAFPFPSINLGRLHEVGLRDDGGK